MRRRFVQRSGELIEVPQDWRPPPRKGPMIMGDIEPYHCPKTGRMVTSRSERRQIMREHNLIELGNEWDALMQHGDYDDFEEPPEVPDDLANEILEGIE